MYITKKFALKKTRLHSDDTCIDDPTGELPWIDVKAYIEKGGVYYQINNGTIGKGARTYNLSERAMNELINSPASNWSRGSRIELKPDTSNVVELRPTKVVEPDYDIDSDRLFTYDDIPF